MKAIFGLRLRAVCLCVGLDQPSHHRLSNLALRCGWGIEEGEVEQGIGMGTRSHEQANAHHDQSVSHPVLHTRNLSPNSSE